MRVDPSRVRMVYTRPDGSRVEFVPMFTHDYIEICVPRRLMFPTAFALLDSEHDHALDAGILANALILVFRNMRPCRVFTRFGGMRPWIMRLAKGEE